MTAQPKLKLRPSSASRWIACPASARLSTLVPYQESGEAAKIGTAIQGITMTEENCEFALEHLQAIWAVQDELGHVKVEQLFKLYDTPLFSLQGTADVVGWSDSKLTIADLKTGRGYVDADSEQMKIYALGAMKANNLRVKEVEFQIIQPHHGDKRIHRMSADELGVWETQVMMPAIEDAVSDAPRYAPSESACQWCPAKTICSAQKASFDVVAAQPDLTVMKKEEVKEVMLALTPEQIGDILDRAPLVEKFIDAVRAHALDAMEKHSAVIPGWQLQSKRVSRKWLDEGTARAELIAAGLSDVDIFETNLITPAAAEKLLPKDQRVLLDDLTAKVSSGLTLAKDRGLSQ